MFHFLDEAYGSGSGSGYGVPEDTDDEDLVGGRGSGSGSPDREGIDEEVEPRNDEDNELHPMVPANVPPIRYNTTNNHLHPATQTASAASQLHRSLFYYLVPIVVIWFGNTVFDWIPLPF